MNETVIDLYERHAAAWSRDRGRVLMERPWLERLTAGIAPGAAVLDIGCGSGEPIARFLIESGFAVTGVDSSPSLIALCRERFADQQWDVADMRALELGRRFDAIIAWHSLFHLAADDQRPMFARFAAHAAAGGRLLFTTGPDAGEAIGEWQGEPLYHASLGPDEYRRLLDTNGFELIAHETRDAECGDATVWLAQRSC